MQTMTEVEPHWTGRRRSGPAAKPRPEEDLKRRAALAGLALLLSCAPVSAVSYRWASSSYRIYVTGPGSVTLSDIKAALPKVPLAQVAPGVWHLRANLLLEDGAELRLHGTKIGGDVNQLRLQSNNSLDPNSVINITADWGSLQIRSTAVTSWDDATDGPDTEYGTFSRAFIRVRAKLAADGLTPLESRMDIVDSDVGYLGYHAAESYGLVWKVIGSQPNLFDRVNVYGDILRSRIHHNYFGVYTYGSYGQQFADNEVDHNVSYGFDPHDDSDFLVIENNNVHHNGNHGIIASQRCNNLIIRNNVSWNNTGNGIMLHRYCDDTLVEDNRCLRNGDSGIALFDTRRATVRRNICLYNFNAGIRLSVGAAHNTIEENEFAYGGNYGLYLYKGQDAPMPGDDGRPKDNVFRNNLVHRNRGTGIFLTSANNNTFRGNLFYGNSGPLWFVNGRQNLLDSNSIPAGVTARTQGSPSVASTTFVRNHSSLSIQVDPYSATTFEDAPGRVFQTDRDGIPTTVRPDGTTLILTAAEIVKTATVNMRNLRATPDSGTALVNITIWNTSGDLSKGWQTQAGSSTRSITYRVGDLAPGVSYDVIKNGVVTRITSDATGTVTYTDSSVTTGNAEYLVRPRAN
jgi:parallel beta-helix repeat protein